MTTSQISKGVPEGWRLERADPSAGIFGHEWIHEDCKVLQGPGNGESEGCSEIETVIGEPDERGLVLVSTTVDCHDCGAGFWFEHKELG